MGADFHPDGQALIVVWETSDRICGKRLRPLIPVLVEAIERHGGICGSYRRCAPDYWR